MIRFILVAVVVVAVLLVGTWTQNLRHENELLQTRVHGLEKKLAEDKASYDKLYYNFVHEESLVRHGNESADQQVAGFRTQIAAEKQKISELNQVVQSLKGTMKGSPSGLAQSHIDEDNAALAKAQDQLARLNDDGKTVNERSQAYRAEQNQKQSEQKAQIQGALQATVGSIQNLEGQLQALRQVRGDPTKKQRMQDLSAQLAELRTRHHQLDEQNKELGQVMRNTAQAITQEVRSEQTEMKGDRDQAQRQINSLKADIEKWKKQAGTQSEANRGQSEKMKSVELEISQHLERVKTLEHLIDSLTKSPN